MRIRAFREEDIATAKDIFAQFYASDANGTIKFPDFRKYICAFTVPDEDGKIITTGGIRALLEIQLITDKNRTPRERILALKEVLPAVKFIAKSHKTDCLHAITDDPTWASHMKQNGFISRGEDLEIHVEDIK